MGDHDLLEQVDALGSCAELFLDPLAVSVTRFQYEILILAILTALLERRETGKGHRIEAGLFETLRRDIGMQGNVIRYNYFHDIYGPKGHGTAAVYLDDYHCGHKVYGNVFYRSGRPGAGP